MTHITFFIQDGNSTWTRSSYNRSHTHDIRALALVEGDKGNKSASLLISGGTVQYITAQKTTGRAAENRCKS